MILPSPTNLFIWIPAIVRLGLEHSMSSDKYNLLKEHENSIDILKGILFYSYLYQNVNRIVYYDDFTFIPITYDEIEVLGHYGNTIERSLLFNRIQLYSNQYKLKLV